MNKLYKIFTTFEKIILSVPFIFLSLAIVTDVIARKFFSFSFSWLEELSRYIFIFAVFLGASIAVTRNLHPRMSALQNAVGEKGARIMLLAGNLICLALFIYLSRFAILHVRNLINIGTRASSTNVSLWVFYVIIPVSMISIVIRFVLQIIFDIKNLVQGGAKA